MSANRSGMSRMQSNFSLPVPYVPVRSPNSKPACAETSWRSLGDQRQRRAVGVSFKIAKDGDPAPARGAALVDDRAHGVGLVAARLVALLPRQARMTGHART